MSTTPLGVSNRVDAPPIEIQEMIFILKIIEFFVSEKLFLLIFIKRALGDIAKQLNTQQHYDKARTDFDGQVCRHERRRGVRSH